MAVKAGWRGPLGIFALAAFRIITAPALLLVPSVEKEILQKPLALNFVGIWSP